MSLTITPDKQIGFTLSRGDQATKSMLTLANNTGDYFAFKVKTTQPRRYLVRPNQGLVKVRRTGDGREVCDGREVYGGREVCEKRDVWAE